MHIDLQYNVLALHRKRHRIQAYYLRIFAQIIIRMPCEIFTVSLFTPWLQLRR